MFRQDAQKRWPQSVSTGSSITSLHTPHCSSGCGAVTMPSKAKPINNNNNYSRVAPLTGFNTFTKSGYTSCSFRVCLGSSGSMSLSPAAASSL